MNRLIKRGLLSVAGVVVTLAWWSLKPGGSGNQHSDHIPATVWGGGGGRLTVEVNTNCDARVHLSFEGAYGSQHADELLEAGQTVGPGSHSFTIDVPEQVGGLVELSASEPKQGDALSWRLLVDGQVVDEQSQTLNEQLEPGWGFFLQMGFDDFGNAVIAEDW